MKFPALLLVFLILILPHAALAGTVETDGQSWTTDGTADQVEINTAIKAGDHIDKP